jgi:replication factor C large subunit
MMWSDVYRPARIEDMVGNEEARMDVAKWLLKWFDGTKPLFLIGPPGVGKTTIVKALADQLNYDLIEMNASDARNKNILSETILPILRNRSLIAEKTMLFLDEVDGISARQDVGGIESLIALIKEPTIPIIMAANRKDTRLKTLIKLCKVIEFERVHPSLLLLYLNHVLEKENKKMDFKEKTSVMRNANGDIRSLLNVAQSKISGYDSTRDFSVGIEISNAITNFFSSLTVEGAGQILSNVEGSYSDPRFYQSPEQRRKDIIYAFFSSIVSSEIGLEKIADTLDVLSKCDLIVGRVSKKRHWVLLKYVDIILSHSLFPRLMGSGITYKQYSLPWQISAPIIARRVALRQFLLRLAERTHMSVSKLSATYLPYLFNILGSQKIDLRQFVEGLDLDPKAAESLSKDIARLKVSKR